MSAVKININSCTLLTSALHGAPKRLRIIVTFRHQTSFKRMIAA